LFGLCDRYILVGAGGDCSVLAWVPGWKGGVHQLVSGAVYSEIASLGWGEAEKGLGAETG